MNKRHRELAL